MVTLLNKKGGYYCFCFIIHYPFITFVKNITT